MPYFPSGGLGLPIDLTGATAATRYVGGTATGSPGSGTFVAGDFIITQDGKLFICTAGGSPGTWTSAVAATSPGTILGVVNYGPVSFTQVATTQVASAPIDTTNLVLPITVPASGNILVMLNAVCSYSDNTSFHSYYWGLDDGTVAVGQTQSMLQEPVSNIFRQTAYIYATGLTPGAKTLRWVHGLLTANGTGTIFMMKGDLAANNSVGPAVMVAYAA